MSSLARRKQREAEFQASCLQREAEEAEWQRLSDYERVERVEDIADVKRLLHWLLNKIEKETNV